MEISSNSNNYQSRSGTSTIQSAPQEQKYTNEEVYKASQGNVSRNSESELAATPQGQLNVNNAQEQKATEDATATQANRDSQRESATNTLAQQSKKSQVEIYLAVATEGNNNPIENNTVDIIESLRDVQKQNNAVEAFATYKENQNTPANNLARGLVG